MGRFKSTLHRVVIDGSADRYSIPFFFEPNFDTRVECLPSCCSPDKPPRHAATSLEACIYMQKSGVAVSVLFQGARMITSITASASWLQEQPLGCSRKCCWGLLLQVRAAQLRLLQLQD